MARLEEVLTVEQIGGADHPATARVAIEQASKFLNRSDFDTETISPSIVLGTQRLLESLLYEGESVGEREVRRVTVDDTTLWYSEGNTLHGMSGMPTVAWNLLRPHRFSPGI